jgi:serine/threonine protein kinase
MASPDLDCSDTALPAVPYPKSVPETNPYANLGVIGIGMTGLVLKLDEKWAVKVAKVYSLDQYTGTARSNTEYINEINKEALKNERNIYERLGSHKGIIPCFKASDHGIELEFADQGDLESYIETAPEPPESLKTRWILSITEALTHVHSRRVFVDEIALRNILVCDGQVKLADFGQSILLPLTADVDTICENDLTAKCIFKYDGGRSLASEAPMSFNAVKPSDIPAMTTGSMRIKSTWSGRFAGVHLSGPRYDRIENIFHCSRQLSGR